MGITFRRGTPDDADASFEVLVQSIADVTRRSSGPEAPWSNPAVIRDAWGKLPVFDYVARTADQWWVADRDGEVVGYARAILHDGVRELTEFMVLPTYQSAGVGRELLALAFQAEGVRRRTVIASNQEPALARYLKSGVFHRFPIRSFARAPELVPVETDLIFEAARPTARTLAAFGKIDQVVLDCRRDDIHEFLLSVLQGYAYRRGDEIVGYGYLGPRPGPFALLDVADCPAVLAHAEHDAASRGLTSFDVLVPMVNRAAVTYLLAR